MLGIWLAWQTEWPARPSVPAALLDGGIGSADSLASIAADTRSGSRHYPGGKHSLQLPTEKLRPPTLKSTYWLALAPNRCLWKGWEDAFANEVDA